jgi:putative restriction endonuclease
VATLDELAQREAVLAWFRVRSLTRTVFTRADLASIEILGTAMRLVDTQEGIWVPPGWSAALTIVTAYHPLQSSRPYDDGLGPDNLLRYKWRGTDANQFKNRALRAAMEAQQPVVWLLGVGYVPGTKRQVHEAIAPVWPIAEESEDHQFVIALDVAQRALVRNGSLVVSEVERRYNERLARTRVHQRAFRSMVLSAYRHQCAVCGLPFVQLIDAAHIIDDADGGSAAVTNGLALCRIHHGAFDTNLLGISPDRIVHVNAEVLDTFDGPTLQHALKGAHRQPLRVVPTRLADRPDPWLLEQRFAQFQAQL